MLQYFFLEKILIFLIYYGKVDIIKKIKIIQIKIISAEILNIWNKRNKNKVVTKDATLPGMFLIFPIPNIVTNK